MVVQRKDFHLSTEMNFFKWACSPRILTCADTITDDTIVPTKDDNYPWLDPDDKKDKKRHMTDVKILRHK